MSDQPDTSATKKRTIQESETQDQGSKNSKSNSKSNSITPITLDGERPQKKFYRQRAHCNPLSHNDSFHYPIKPQLMDWTSEYYPTLNDKNNNNNNKHIQPTVLDVGCGFGGLTMALGAILPTSTIILGMEIRAKVTEYVRLRIVAERKLGTHHNVSVMRTNSQKFLPNYFRPQSLEKLFFCFPDPHFKRKNHPRRIISDRLLDEYTHLLQPSTGKLYCITDVRELHDWHVSKCHAHPLLECLVVGSDDATYQTDALVPQQNTTKNSTIDDPCIAAMRDKTDEGQKVARNKGHKYWAVYRRISLAEEENTVQVTADTFFPTDGS